MHRPSEEYIVTLLETVDSGIPDPDTIAAILANQTSPELTPAEKLVVYNRIFAFADVCKEVYQIEIDPYAIGVVQAYIDHGPGSSTLMLAVAALHAAIFAHRENYINTLRTFCVATEELFLDGELIEK